MSKENTYEDLDLEILDAWEEFCNHLRAQNEQDCRYIDESTLLYSIHGIEFLDR